MTKLNFIQRSPEWHEWRNYGLGSSDIASIMGMSPYQTAYELWEIKMGFREGPVMNPAMQRGCDFEDEARVWAQKHLDLPDCPPECFEGDVYPFMKASLDGYCEAKGIILEIKVPTPNTYRSMDPDEYLKRYICQIQWQLMLSGMDTAYFVIYSPEEQSGIVLMVNEDTLFQSDLELKAKAFWEDFLSGKAPALSDKDYEEIDSPELKKLCERYRDVHKNKSGLDDAVKILKNSLDKLKSEIIEYGNDSNFRTNGLTCYRNTPRISYDMEAMLADGIDISKYKKVKNEIGSYTIRVSK